MITFSAELLPVTFHNERAGVIAMPAAAAVLARKKSLRVIIFDIS
jgi:hypothetical protein